MRLGSGWLIVMFFLNSDMDHHYLTLSSNLAQEREHKPHFACGETEAQSEPEPGCRREPGQLLLFPLTDAPAASVAGITSVWG